MLWYAWAHKYHEDKNANARCCIQRSHEKQRGGGYDAEEEKDEWEEEGKGV